MRPLLASLVAIGLIATGAAAPAVAANQSVLSVGAVITDTSNNPITQVASPMTDYRLQISYSCNIEDCTDSKITIDAPQLDPTYGLFAREFAYNWTAPFVGATISPATPAGNAAARGPVTIDLGTVPEARNGSFYVQFRVNTSINLGSPPGQTLGGSFFPTSMFERAVTFTSTNAPVAAQASASAQWVSTTPTAPTLTLSTAQAVRTDTAATVRLSGSSRCMTDGGSTNAYLLCARDFTATAQLPPNAQYVPGSGGAYDPASHTVTFTSSGTPASRGLAGISPSFQVTFPAGSYPTTGTDCLATESFSATHMMTYLDGKVASATPAGTTITVDNCAPFADGDAYKVAANRSAGSEAAPVWYIPLAGQAPKTNAMWSVYGYNMANVPAQITVNDTFGQADLPVTRISAQSTHTAAFPVSLQVTLDNPAQTVTATLATTSSVYTAPAGRTITQATATSSTLPASANTDTDGTVKNVWLRMDFTATLSSGATPGTRINTAQVSLSYPSNPELGTTQLPDASRTVTLQQQSNISFTANAVSGAVTNGGAAIPGSEVIWNTYGTIGALPAGSTIVPQYVFLAPVGWSIPVNGASLSPGVSGATFDYRTLTYNGQTHQAVVVNWPGPLGSVGGVNLPRLNVKTTPSATAPAGASTARFFFGEVGNQTVSTYSPTRSTDTTDIDADGAVDDVFASRTGSVQLEGTSAIAVSKEICRPDPSAIDGCEWIADPSVRVGVPPTAGSIRYRVTVINNGNANLSNVVAYDVLPHPGDMGTSTATATTPRNSTVQEQLASIANADAGITFAYSTSTNPPRPEVYTASGSLPAPSGDWNAPQSGASSIRATIASLPAFQSRSFEYTAALIGGTADKLACNSVAAGAALQEPVEPAPVCASTEEGDLRIETADRFPLQEGRVGSLPFVVTNGGGSQQVPGTVTFSVPASLQIVDLTNQNWHCAASGSTPVTVTCDPVNGDGTRRLLQRDVSETLVLKVRPTSGAGDDACVTGAVEGLIYDPDLDNNSTPSCSFVAAGTALLDVEKTDGVTVARIGDTLTYTITARNRLTGEAVTGAVITDTLPSDAKFVSASDGGTVSGADANGFGGTVTWPSVGLAAAGVADGSGQTTSGSPDSVVTRTVVVTVPPTADASLLNRVRVSAPDPADSSATLQAQASDTDGLQRLSVTKASNAPGAGVRTDDVVTYTVTLVNDGTVAYTAGDPAWLVDDLSGILDDASYVADSAQASVDGGAQSPVAAPSAGRISWSGPLAAGSSVVLTYQVRVGDGTSGDRLLTNTAHATDQPTACAGDVDQNGISCAIVTTPFAPTLAKHVVSSTQNDDGTWTTMFALTVSNLSPTTAATYSLTDALRYGSGIQVVSAAVTSAPAGVTPAAWSGTGAIATGVSIPANTQHAYQVTVTANAHQTPGTPAAQCLAGVQSGFANQGTLALTDGRTETAEACAEPVAPAVEKTVAAPVQLPDGRWDIAYTVTVRNPHRTPGDLAYTLRDVLTIPSGISVDRVTVAGPSGAPVNPGFNGTSDTALLTGADRIPAATPTSEAARVYTITITTNAPSGAGTPTQLACPPAGTGGYLNTVTLFAGTSTTQLASDDACADATPQPMPEIVKSLVSSTVDTAGIWSLVYQIDVRNPDALYSTRYSLDDDLAFASGTLILSASAASSEVAVSPTWNGQGVDRLVTDQALAPRTTHTYSVSVQVDPGSLDRESALADCRVDSGETGTGFRNVATVTSGARSAFAEACQPFTDPSVVKSTVGSPTQNPADGLWTVEYDVTVTNRSTTTTAAYTLEDTLGFPADVDIVDVTVTASAGGSANGSFDGVDDTELGSGTIEAAADDTTPATQIYRITVEFAIPAGIDTGTRCDPAQGAGGLRNEVEIGVGPRSSGAVTCVDLPDVPPPGLTKTVLSQAQQADGTWELTYRVVVANPSNTAASRYTLDDALALGDGIAVVGDPTIVARPAGATVDPDWDGQGATTITENLLLPAGGSHTYTVRAVLDAGSLRGTDPAGDCALDQGEAGTGFGNTASLDTGVTTVGAQACARAWDPSVTKELNGQPVHQRDGSWLLSYTMTVTNPSSAQLSYGLVDEVDFPEGTQLTVVSAAGRSGAPDVQSDWDGQTQTQFVADGASLPANAVHVFDVTLRAVLPADQESTPDGWANTLTVESGVDGVIQTPAPTRADILLPKLAVSKSATPSEPVLRIGDTVTYEVTVENVGEGDFTGLHPAVVWDDLEGVLDDAALVSDPVATPDAGVITRTGAAGYRWADALVSGDSVTIAYAVAVTGGGDADLINVAFAAAPIEEAPVTPLAADCASTACAATETPLPALEVTKTASAANVAPGETVTYTVTVTNTGGVDIPADDPAAVTDDLSDVLDDATFASDARASTGTVHVNGTTLTWTGGLAVGETATITYSVSVWGAAPDGAKLVNLVVTDPTLVALALDGTASDGQATTTTAVMRLAVTGTALAPMWIAALVLLMLGFVARHLSRRRRTGTGDAA